MGNRFFAVELFSNAGNSTFSINNGSYVYTHPNPKPTAKELPVRHRLNVGRMQLQEPKSKQTGSYKIIPNF